MESVNGMRVPVLTASKLDVQQFIEIFTSSTFPEQASKDWITQHQTFAVQACIAYFFVVFGIKYFMRDRTAFDLSLPLNVWNASLAVFSIFGTAMLLPEFVDTLQNKGFQASYCKVYDFTKGTNGFWTWLFIVSKLFELMDTIFLVLRKKPLIFLHWFHHILTLIYAFYSYPLTPGFNRWGIFMNFLVHSFMYSYYFLRSMKVQLPKSVSVFITSLQILQFVISVSILVHLGVLIYVQKIDCDFDASIFKLAMFMDVTYLILFINFFAKAYIFGSGRAKHKSKKDK